MVFPNFALNFSEGGYFMKSKKLLSALMAVVMLISTLSVGFYAIADDNVDTADTAVSEAEDKITAFSDYADSLFSTDSENYDAAVAAYDEAAAAVEALSEEQKLQMDVALYGYMLNYVAESVGRDADQGTGTAAKTWATMNALSDIESVIGDLPEDYQAVYDAYEAFYVLYGDENASVYEINSSYGWDAYDDAVAAFNTWTDALSEMSQAQFAFSNYLNPSADSSTAGFYFGAESTSESSVTAANIISYQFNILKDTEGVSDVVLPERSDYISRSGFIIYSYSWVGDNNGQTYIDAWNAAYSQIIDELVPIATEAYQTVLEKFDTVFPGLADAAEAILGIGLDLAEGSDVSSDDVLEAYDKINSLSDSARAFFDAVAENSSIQLGATLNTAIEFNESTTAQNAYNNTPTITYITVSDVIDSFDAYIDDLNYNEFVEYVASVDVDSRTTEQITTAQELYAVLSSDKKDAIDDDTYNKFLEIIVPLKDTTDYADVIAAFESTAFVRPPESSVAWTEGGIQSFADTLEGLFAADGLLSTFGINFNLESLISENLYSASIINMILDLYATLSHNTTELVSVSGVSLTLGTIIEMVITPEDLAEALPEDKYSSIVEQINAVAVTADDPEDTNELDKIAEIDFTAEDWGFTEGDKDGFIDALLAVLRPVTQLLAPDAAISFRILIITVSIEIGLNMFGYIVGDDGEYIPGIYENLLQLFEQLGLNDLPTAEEYEANYYAVREEEGEAVAADEFLRPIIESLFTNIIDPLCESPVNTLIDVLPRLAYIIDEDRLNTYIQNVINAQGGEAVYVKVLGATVYTVDLSSLSIDLSTDAINDLIPDTIDVGSLIGDGTELVLNIGDIPWSELADCVTLSAVPSSTIYHEYTLLRTGETDSCLSTIMYWLYDVVFADADTYATVKNLILDLIPSSYQFLVRIILFTNLFDLVQAAGKVDGYGILLDHSLLGGTPTGLEIWKIEASAGEGGSVDPSGTIELKQTDSTTFTITADEGNTIYSLTVNGEAIADAAGLTSYAYTVEGSAVTSSDSDLFYPADVIIEVIFADEDGNPIGITPEEPESSDPDEGDDGKVEGESGSQDAEESETPDTESPDEGERTGVPGGENPSTGTESPSDPSTDSDDDTADDTETPISISDTDDDDDDDDTALPTLNSSNVSLPDTGADQVVSMSVITLILAAAAGVIVWLLLRKRIVKE